MDVATFLTQIPAILVLVEDMGTTSIAVLMTCFNRKEKTLTCLQALFNQVLPPDVELQVYLVDDGSTDGTSETIAQTYPQVKIIPGSGSLFWNGGMRLAFSEAEKTPHDYHLWLNDDTLLYPNALKTLLESHQQLIQQGKPEVIIAGSTCDETNQELSYGGVYRNNKWHPFKYDLVPPEDQPKPCETINGNCVLVPAPVVQKVGNLDAAYSHYAGDLDYGLRAKKFGITCWIAPGFQGTCSQNPLGKSWVDSQEMSLRDRLQKANQPKGFPPKERFIFAQRHGGPFWLFYWLLPYRRLITSLFVKPKAN